MSIPTSWRSAANSASMGTETMTNTSITTVDYRLSGHTVHEHSLAVPLNHGDPTQGDIGLFAREIVRDGGEDHPHLVWLQGGPGNRANRPAAIGGWMDRALEDYRVVLLDQRGTGLSTPADAQSLPEIGAPEEQATYLSHFRADSIVADCEALRSALGIDSWTVLGQSFGGFIVTAYLSQAPEHLDAALITAGLPALTGGPERAYQLTFAQTERRNRQFFARYPQDRSTLNRLASHLRDTEEFLPTGERLTVRRLLQVGMGLGTASGFDALHFMFEDPFTTSYGTVRLRERFLREAGANLSFASHPLYALMHETIYAQGEATNWAADRVRATLPQFDPDATEPLLTGEHIFPWQFDEDPALTPLKETADLLAHRPDFPGLYDPSRLAQNYVPAAAAVYFDDMFVPRELSLQTADAIRGLRTIITNEYQHDGIRVDGYNLLGRLLATLRR